MWISSEELFMRSTLVSWRGSAQLAGQLKSLTPEKNHNDDNMDAELRNWWWRLTLDLVRKRGGLIYISTVVWCRSFGEPWRPRIHASAGYQFNPTDLSHEWEHPMQISRILMSVLVRHREILRRSVPSEAAEGYGEVPLRLLWIIHLIISCHRWHG